MAGSTMGPMGPELPPHPHGPYQPGKEGHAPFFPAGRPHGWTGYPGHPQMRGYHPGEGPDMPPFARASSVPPTSADTAAMGAPATDSQACGRGHCGRRRGWWLWGSSSPKQAGNDGCQLPAGHSAPGRDTAAGQQAEFPAGARHGGFPDFHGDHKGYPGYGSGGPPFRGDYYGRFGPLGHGYPPFHGYRYPGYYGGNYFPSGPESRYIFREFDFQ